MYALVLLVIPSVVVTVVRHEAVRPTPVAAAVPLPTARAAAAPAARRVPTCGKPASTAMRSAPATAGRTVALTFDDGPGRHTPAVLDVLRREHVHATFFMIGDQLAAHRDTARRVLADGHTIGNHSETHPEVAPGTGWRAATLERELTSSQHHFATQLGTRPCFFRPPGGVLRGAPAVVREHGMSIVLWSVDPRDWDDHHEADVEHRAEAGLAQQHPVVLLHDGGSGGQATVDALPKVIDRYRSRGYTFVTVDGRS